MIIMFPCCYIATATSPRQLPGALCFFGFYLKSLACHIPTPSFSDSSLAASTSITHHGIKKGFDLHSMLVKTSAKSLEGPVQVSSKTWTIPTRWRERASEVLSNRDT